MKNVARLRTILGTFGRHGLEGFLHRMGLEQWLPATAKREDVERLTVPERLRMAFEDLGPTFVKLGQLLSNRPDMIPETFIEEFSKLQDNVIPCPSTSFAPRSRKSSAEGSKTTMRLSTRRRRERQYRSGARGDA